MKLIQEESFTFATMEKLPIHEIRQDLQRSLEIASSCIICAPPGSGKSTLVPQFVFDDGISAGKTVIVLQPRRIAARMLATYIAAKRQISLGNEVGYRVRFEGKSSKETKILFLTEGILLNRLFQKDTLEEVGTIIFDEFHERHLETDLSLAMAIELQKKYRPDLKLIVMSATLDIELAKTILGRDCPVIESHGRAFPVEIKYVQSSVQEPIWERAAKQMELNQKSLNGSNVLIFMPGSFEINKTIEALHKKDSLHHCQILALHGSLTRETQDKAVGEGNNKIIVSTNVAETSLTIPGVRLVIDSGLAKVPRFDAKRGINTLFVENISKSSADQRAGRAGRIAPGTCVRLWSEFEDKNRVSRQMPEIHRLDISEIILNLLALGYKNLEEFPWIEKPDAQKVEHALLLLSNLDAIDRNNNLTITGKEMASMGVHPRYARLLLKSKELDCLSEACMVVAISQSSGLLNRSKDPILRQEQEFTFGNPASDLLFELNAWIWARQQDFNSKKCGDLGINAQNAKQISNLALQLLQKNRNSKASENELPHEFLSFEKELKLRECIFLGFLDFLAIRHKLNSPVCQMMFGKSAQLHSESIVNDSTYLVATELEESKQSNGVRLFLKKASKIEPEWLSELSLGNIIVENETIFDWELKKVVTKEKHLFNDLLIFSEIKETRNHEESSKILTTLVLKSEIEFKNWNDDVEHYINRANFAAKNAPHYLLPIIDEEARHFILQQSLYTCKSLKDIEKASPWAALKAWYSKEQLAAIDYLAPISIELPRRKYPVKLRYDEKGDAVLSETVQALYDCPPVMICEGKVQVVYEILAPSRRPVQITRDLEQFWKNSYFEVKKELKGRYPKHEWR